MKPDEKQGASYGRVIRKISLSPQKLLRGIYRYFPQDSSMLQLWDKDPMVLDVSQLDELLTQCRLQGNQDADGFVWISGLHVHGRAWAFRQERGELAVRFHGRYGERRVKRAAASAICDALPGSGDLEGWVRLALCVLIDADADEIWD